MAKAHISPTNTTDKTIRSIDRKRERERKFMLTKTRENSEVFAAKLTQRLIDKKIIETDSVSGVRKALEMQLKLMASQEEFDLQLKIAPVRTLVADPNFVSLYLTQYIIEDLINHPDIQDVFGNDIDIYLAVDSVMLVLRPA